MKFNPYHDEQGRFTTAEGAVEPGTHARLKPDRGVEVADNSDYSTTMSDAGSGRARQDVAIGIDPFSAEPPKIQSLPAEPQKPGEPSTPLEPVKPIEPPKPDPGAEFKAPDRQPSRDNPNDYELGFDPGQKKFQLDEVETAWRLQELLQQPLRRDPSGDAEWIGPDGTAYDAMGMSDWNYYKAKEFTASIDWHLLKSGVTTVIDMTGANEKQINEVTAYLDRLPAESRKRIIGIGF